MALRTVLSGIKPFARSTQIGERVAVRFLSRDNFGNYGQEGRQWERRSFDEPRGNFGQFHFENVSIPSDRVGRFIGKGGANIKHLQQEFRDDGVRFRLDNGELIISCKNPEVALRAKERVLEEIERVAPAVDKTVSIPAEASRLVKPEWVKLVRATTRATFTYNAIERSFFIRGPESAVKAAETEIRIMIKKAVVSKAAVRAPTVFSSGDEAILSPVPAPGGVSLAEHLLIRKPVSFWNEKPDKEVEAQMWAAFVQDTCERVGKVVEEAAVQEANVIANVAAGKHVYYQAAKDSSAEWEPSTVATLKDAERVILATHKDLKNLSLATIFPNATVSQSVAYYLSIYNSKTDELHSIRMAEKEGTLTDGHVYGSRQNLLACAYSDNTKWHSDLRLNVISEVRAPLSEEVQQMVSAMKINSDSLMFRHVVPGLQLVGVTKVVSDNANTNGVCVKAETRHLANLTFMRVRAQNPIPEKEFVVNFAPAETVLGIQSSTTPPTPEAVSELLTSAREVLKTISLAPQEPAAAAPANESAAQVEPVDQQ
eukprot:Colp12_sorted_trinity150504_noHs@1695